MTKTEKAAEWLRRAAEIYGDDNDDAAVARELSDLADYVATLDPSQPRLLVERNADYGDECDKFHLFTSDEQLAKICLALLPEYIEIMKWRADDAEEAFVEARRIVAEQDLSMGRRSPKAYDAIQWLTEYDDDLSVTVERFATT